VEEADTGSIAPTAAVTRLDPAHPPFAFAFAPPTPSITKTAEVKRITDRTMSMRLLREKRDLVTTDVSSRFRR